MSQDQIKWQVFFCPWSWKTTFHFILAFPFFHFSILKENQSCSLDWTIDFVASFFLFERMWNLFGNLGINQHHIFPSFSPTILLLSVHLLNRSALISVIQFLYPSKLFFSSYSKAGYCHLPILFEALFLKFISPSRFFILYQEQDNQILRQILNFETLLNNILFDI
jgi:hypothetical protein